MGSNLHEIELVQHRIVIVGVSQSNLVLVLGLGEVRVRSWLRAGLVQVGSDAMLVQRTYRQVVQEVSYPQEKISSPQ